MDPHEHDQLAKEAEGRMRAAYDKLTAIVSTVPERVRKNSDPEDEPLPDISPSRSSRIAEHVRKHKKAYIGGAATAFTAALASEVFRRFRGER